MDISLGEPRIYGLEPRLAFEDIRRRAEDKRASAVAGGLGGLLQRPKAEDVVLVASQRRVEPVWHLLCTAHYAYDRSRMYTVPASAVTLSNSAPVVAASPALTIVPFTELSSATPTNVANP